MGDNRENSKNDEILKIIFKNVKNGWKNNLNLKADWFKKNEFTIEQTF